MPVRSLKAAEERLKEHLELPCLPVREALSAHGLVGGAWTGAMELQSGGHDQHGAFEHQAEDRAWPGGSETHGVDLQNGPKWPKSGLKWLLEAVPRQR